MSTKNQYINMYFTKDDAEILKWANMIRENGLNLGTWIQAILVAEIAGKNLDIGSICIPNDADQMTSQPGPKLSLFGDDTHTEKKTAKTGWNIRGENGKLKEGSVLSIKVTRQTVQDAIYTAKKRHKHIGSYIKTLIRQKIKACPSNTNRLPNNADIFDLFILCERKQRSFPNDTSKRGAAPEIPRQQAKPKQNKHLARQPLYPNGPDKQTQQDTTFQPPKEQPCAEKEQQQPKRNPLLSYINNI